MISVKILKLSILVVILATVETFSQNSFDIHFGLANPRSDFASEDIYSDDAAGAATGLNVGLKYIYQLSDNGLGLYLGVDYNQNGLKKDYKKDIEDIFESAGISNADFDFYKYRNIPISAGLNYTLETGEKVDLFFNAGITLNFLKISDFEIKADNGAQVTTEFDFANNIGFKLGAGFLINRRVSISIDYWGLGTHDINGKMKSGLYSQEEDIDDEQKIDLLTISLGFNLL